MATNGNVLLVLPTLNEISGLKVILPQIPLELFRKVIVLDGCSTDGTIEFCESNGLEVFVQKQRGLRNGMMELLTSDLANYDYILTFSPDGNCDPGTLHGFVEMLDGNVDLVIGSRYAGDQSSADDDVITAFGNWVFTRSTNLLFRSKYTDVFSIYRAFKPNLVWDLCLHEDESYRFAERAFHTKLSWEPLMSYRAAKYRKNIADYPVGEPARIGGERKLQVVRWGAAFLAQLIRETWYTPAKIVKGH